MVPMIVSFGYVSAFWLLSIVFCASFLISNLVRRPRLYSC